MSGVIRDHNTPPLVSFFHSWLSALVSFHQRYFVAESTARCRRRRQQRPLQQQSSEFCNNDDDGFVIRRASLGERLVNFEPPRTSDRAVLRWGRRCRDAVGLYNRSGRSRPSDDADEELQVCRISYGTIVLAP